jgi:hypothetical protein
MTADPARDPEGAVDRNGWVDDGPRALSDGGPWWREALLVAAFIVGLTCLFNYEVVFLGRTFFPVQGIGVMGQDAAYGAGPLRPDPIRLDPSATRLQNGAWQPEIRRQVRAGVVPLWNPHQGFGSPLHADAIPAQLNPFQWPKLVDNSILMWDMILLARTMLGALAMYLFMRLLGFSPAARAMGVLAYVFCGHFLLFDLNMWLEAYLVLPLILLGEEKILRGSLRSGVLVTTLAVAGQVLVGMPEITLAVFLFAAAYGGIGMVRLLRSPARPPTWRWQVAALALAWLAGIGLSAPLLIPMFELVAQSNSMTNQRAIFGLDFAGVEDLSLWLMPYLTRLPYLPELKSRDEVMHGLHYIGTFSGAALFMTAVYGALTASRTVYRRLGIFLAAAAVLVIAKSFGLPLLNELGRLPGLSITHIPKWFGPVVGFCLAMLAAVGVHHLATTRRDDSPRAANAAGAATLALAAFGIVVNRAAIAAVDPAIPWLPWFSIAVASIFGAATWWILRFRPRFGVVTPAIACVILVAGELFVLAPKGVRQDRIEPFQEPPFVAYLKRQPDAATARVLGLDTLLFPNSSTAFGLPDVRALDALYSDRYMTYIREFISPGSKYWFSGIERTTDGRTVEIVNNPWLDLTGTRYLIAPPGASNRMLRPVSVPSFLSGLSEETVADLGARVAPMTIGGDTREALQIDRPGALTYRMFVDERAPILEFAVGAIPDARTNSRDLGSSLLRAALTVTQGASTDILFDENLKFRGDQANHGWFEVSVDLSPYAGETVALRFTAKAPRDLAFTAIGWADLRMTGVDGASVTQFVPIYEDDDVTVFENTEVAPRAFLVRDVTRAESMQEAVALMKGGTIDPGVTAVVEGDPGIGAAADPVGSSDSAIISTYAPDRVTIDVTAGAPSLLVLTDLFYPGWQATVDGEPGPILPTDAAFRGVAVPAGEHRVEFVYAPASFRLGLIVAGVSALMLLIWHLGYGMAHRPAGSASNDRRVQTT